MAASAEELGASADAGCLSTALVFGLAGAGYPPASITKSADVSFAFPAGNTGIRAGGKRHA